MGRVMLVDVGTSSDEELPFEELNLNAPTSVDPEEIGSTFLLYANLEAMELKDVYKEVRAKRDITRFATNHNSVILLDRQESTVQEIMTTAVNQFVTNEQLDPSLAPPALEALMNKGLPVPGFATSIHAAEDSDYDLDFISFAVAVAEVPKLRHRCIGLVRLQEKSNL